MRRQPFHTKKQRQENDQHGGFEDPAIPLRTARDKSRPDEKRERARRVHDPKIPVRHAGAGDGLAISTVYGHVIHTHVEKAHRHCKLSQAEEQHKRAEARRQQA